MLNGEGSENGEKKLVGLISKKRQLFTCSTLFCTFLCRCCCTTTSWNFLATCFMEETSYVLTKILFACVPVRYFFTAAHFHLAGRWYFSWCSHRRYKTDFNDFLSTKFASFVFISCSSSFSVILVSVDIKGLLKSRGGPQIDEVRCGGSPYPSWSI